MGGSWLLTDGRQLAAYRGETVECLYIGDSWLLLYIRQSGDCSQHVSACIVCLIVHFMKEEQVNWNTNGKGRLLAAFVQYTTGMFVWLPYQRRNMPTCGQHRDRKIERVDELVQLSAYRERALQQNVATCNIRGMVWPYRSPFLEGWAELFLYPLRSLPDFAVQKSGDGGVPGVSINIYSEVGNRGARWETADCRHILY
jgi:hypothetical protein